MPHSIPSASNPRRRRRPRPTKRRAARKGTGQGTSKPTRPGTQASGHPFSPRLPREIVAPVGPEAARAGVEEHLEQTSDQRFEQEIPDLDQATHGEKRDGKAGARVGEVGGIRDLASKPPRRPAERTAAPDEELRRVGEQAHSLDQGEQRLAERPEKLQSREHQRSPFRRLPLAPSLGSDQRPQKQASQRNSTAFSPTHSNKNPKNSSTTARATGRAADGLGESYKSKTLVATRIECDRRRPHSMRSVTQSLERGQVVRRILYSSDPNRIISSSEISVLMFGASFAPFRNVPFDEPRSVRKTPCSVTSIWPWRPET